MISPDSHIVDDAAPPKEIRLRWWLEIVYVLGFYLIYTAVRNRFGSANGGAKEARVAFEHALDIIDIQKNLGLYFERDLQNWYLDLPQDGLIRIWNIFYGTAHFAVTILALVWLFRVNKPRYSLWRNAFAATTALALIGFSSFSLMPPRLLDDPGEFGGCQIYAPAAAEVAEKVGDAGCDRYGFIDTVDIYGGWLSFGEDGVKDISNQWAAMPSMHIGWSIWSSLVLMPLIRRRELRLLAAAYPAVTLFTIMVTGNHYWIDAIGGAVTLVCGYMIAKHVIPRITPWDRRRSAADPLALQT